MKNPTLSEKSPLSGFTKLAWRAPALLAIVLWLCVVYVLLNVMGASISEKILESFGARGPGQGSWRYLSSIFLHFDFLHLLFNALALLSIGAAVESIAGTGFFLLCFLFSGVGGGLASGLLNPAAISIGASGAVYGLVGALFYLLWWAPDRTPHLEARQRSMQTFLLIFVAVLGCKPSMLDGHWADTAQHWGGLLSGLIICLVLRRNEEKIVLSRPMAASLVVWMTLAAIFCIPGVPEIQSPLN